MKLTKTEIEGLWIVDLRVFGDSRGFFVERFHEKKFKEIGLPTEFVQDNHSFSVPRVLRGLHYQTDPAQGKLVGVIRGSVWDVAVDIRKNSPTYGRSFGVELSAANGRLLWIPPGFAHGFCVLGDEPADMLYKVTGLYNAKTDAGILWNDPDLNINWPIKNPLLSDKDQVFPSFKEYSTKPVF